ncbi:hypothetical protein LXL04_024252 [Taraxacum kok-saghyz]
MASFDVGMVFEMRLPRGIVSSHQSFVVRTMAKKNSRNNPDSSSSAERRDRGVSSLCLATFNCSKILLTSNSIIIHANNQEGVGVGSGFSSIKRIYIFYSSSIAHRLLHGKIVKEEANYFCKNLCSVFSPRLGEHHL